MSIAERLDQSIDGAITDRRIVGAVVIVRRQGELIYQSARGLNDREAGTPMSVDKIFRLSSLTKPIVAATILAMVDDGQLGLDDLATDYLAYFIPKLADGSTPPITIAQLLTHTAGLGGELPLTEAEKDDPKFRAADLNRWHLSLDDNMERLVQVPLLFAPGTGWSYSQSIDVLGAIAGGLVGGTLGDAVAKYVTGPLGMVDTAFHVTDIARLAVPYADSPNGPERMGDPHSVPGPWGQIVNYAPGRILDPKAYHSGGGGMAGTALDFMILLETLRSGGGNILRPATATAGLSNQVPQLAFSQSEGWHFGFFGAVLTDAAVARTPQSVGTSRWGGIYGHSWFVDPVEGLSVVAMTNTGLEGSDGAFRNEIRDAVYGKEH
ncbi:serine hydrolase domain-containing protein [uncultured Devosia sp.]|uniref:serine hydrolase domain-containing protein n=1 Tax=uncultured Devosia sp. TaxID=211434 RepID=UPI0035CA8016